MTMYLKIDNNLLNEALKLSDLSTEDATINIIALREFIDRHRQLKIIELFGKYNPDPDYDYKKGRKKI